MVSLLASHQGVLCNTVRKQGFPEQMRWIFTCGVDFTKSFGQHQSLWNYVPAALVYLCRHLPTAKEWVLISPCLWASRDVRGALVRFLLGSVWWTLVFSDGILSGWVFGNQFNRLVGCLSSWIGGLNWRYHVLSLLILPGIFSCSSKQLLS